MVARPRGYRLGMIVYRRVWWGAAAAAWLLACPMAIVGFPASVFITVPLCAGAVTGALAAAFRPGRRRLVTGARNALLGAAIALGLLGLVAALGGAGSLVVLLFAATSPPVVGLWHAYRDRLRWKEPDTDAPVAGLSTEDLGLAWRASFCALKHAQTAAAVMRIAEQRRRYLDELELRDPEGIRRWLESDADAGSDPTRNLST